MEKFIKVVWNFREVLPILEALNTLDAHYTVTKKYGKSGRYIVDCYVIEETVKNDES